MVANQPLFDWKVVKSKRGRYNGQSPGRLTRRIFPPWNWTDRFFFKIAVLQAGAGAGVIIWPSHTCHAKWTWKIDPAQIPSHDSTLQQAQTFFLLKYDQPSDFWYDKLPTCAVVPKIWHHKVTWPLLMAIYNPLVKGMYWYTNRILEMSYCHTVLINHWVLVIQKGCQAWVLAWLIGQLQDQKTWLEGIYLYMIHISNSSKNLGGGFRYLLFSSLLGEDDRFSNIFQMGLKPPTIDGIFPYMKTIKIEHFVYS